MSTLGVMKVYKDGDWKPVRRWGPRGPRGVDAANAFAEPTLAFGEMHGAGAQGRMIRADARLQFLVANDAETVWPDGNTLTIVGDGKAVANGVEATHTITVGLDVGAISHGDLAGLLADDHTIYIPASGARPLTGDWGAGAFDITAESFEIGNGALQDGATAGYIEVNGVAGIDLAVGGTEIIRMNTYQFLPATTGITAMGDNTHRGSAIYGLDGNFSVGLIMPTNTASWVLRANGTRYVPVDGLTTDTQADHTHSYWRSIKSGPPHEVFDYTGSGGSHSHVTI